MLDALRFVAALSVVAVHLTSRSSPAWDGPVPAEVVPVGRWTGYGHLGVPLFFIISGFVLLMTAWGRDIPAFVASRVGRLFPAYWVAVGFSAVLVLWVWPANPVFFGAFISKTQAALNFTMLQGAFSSPNLDGSYWTLWYEARFYLLIAIFMMVGITRRRVLAFATLWPIIAAIASASGQAFIAAFLMPDYAPFFAGGMLLYLIYRDGHDLGTWLLVGFQVVSGANFATHYYMNLSNSTPVVPSKILIAVLIVGSFAAVAAVTLTRLARWNAWWMTTLGALTYPLYLIHENLGWFTIHLLRDALGSWGAIGVATVVVLTAAVLIHRLVERRFGKRLRAATLRMLERTGRSETAADGVGGHGRGRAVVPAPRNVSPHVQRTTDVPAPMRSSSRGVDGVEAPPVESKAEVGATV
jgi:peptidoglycan/LPS O-acetylase OafA/YrhL